jgi:hypothetical protein
MEWSIRRMEKKVVWILVFGVGMEDDEMLFEYLTFTLYSRLVAG